MALLVAFGYNVYAVHLVTCDFQQNDRAAHWIAMIAVSAFLVPAERAAPNAFSVSVSLLFLRWNRV